jgi:hypothetical protein
MGDRQIFRRQFVCARLAGASVTKTAILLSLSTAAVVKVMTSHTNHGKTSSGTRNSGQKEKLSKRYRLTSKRTVSRNRTTTRTKVTAELNIRLEDSVSTKTSGQELHKPNIHDEADIVKNLISENNVKRRKRWCDDHKTWTSDDWKYVAWSDESSFTLYATSGRVYFCITPKETYNPECLVPTVKHGGGSVTIWAAISWYSALPIITLKDRLTSSDYVGILVNQVVS